MMACSESYDIKKCCNVDCYLLSSNEVCWGEVSAVAEECYGEYDYEWIHACEGHQDSYDDGSYIEEPSA